MDQPNGNDGRDGGADDDGHDGSLPPELRELVQQRLSNAASVPAEIVDALRGLLLPQPSDDHIARGLSAIGALQQAAVDAMRQREAPCLDLLPPLLVEWYCTPSWPASRAWLTDHLGDLLADTAERFQAVVVRARATDANDVARALDCHASLYTRASTAGVDTDYHEIVGEEAFHADDEPDDGTRSAISELQSLWAEFFALDRSNTNPVRQVALGRRILQLDAGRLLTPVSCYQVLLALGNALLTLAQTSGGEQRELPLRQALAYYEAAAREQPRDSTPQQWAAAVGSQGNALRYLAEGQGGAERERSLRQAIAAYDLALLERRLRSRYWDLLATGHAANPPPVHPPRRLGQRGRLAQSPARNLLERLLLNQEAVLAFLDELAIPFDNNQAERGLRGLAVQQKVANCFRSDAAAAAFARITGYLATLRKQGHALLTVLETVVAGRPLHPGFV